MSSSKPMGAFCGGDYVVRQIDPETGEILTPHVVYLRHGEFVKVIDPNNSVERGVKFLKVKTSQKAKRRWQKLSLSEAGFLLLIAEYAAAGSNVLLGDGERGERGLPIGPKDMAKICKVSKATVHRTIRSLLEKGTIGRIQSDRGRAIVINPLYALNGRKPTPWLLGIFRITPEEWSEEERSLI